MAIFIPALKDANPFFDEIINHSKHTFIFEDYKKYNSNYKVVLIHWPEQLFNWQEPTQNDLLELETAIKNWKQFATVVYVVHNLERHYGMTPLFKKLYDLIELNCDVMVHFGSKSYNIYKQKYSSKNHVIIPHPLYENSFKTIDKNKAREILEINQNALVIIAPGKIRNTNERKMVLNAFNRVKRKNKVLIVSNMLKFNFSFDFKGRTYLKKFIDVKRLYETYMNDKKYKKPNYIFNYNFLNPNELSVYLSASDIVFIPRISLLNSGNLFLGLTYNKVVLGPDTGNLTEVLQEFNLPCFNPYSSNSINEAMEKAIDLSENKSFKLDTHLLKKYKPESVAAAWDCLLNELIIDN